MSEVKLINSTQLDANLTSVANAIRIKGGTSADLAFPAGFVSAIDSIPVMETIDLANICDWEIGAVSGITGRTYEQNKTTEASSSVHLYRLRMLNPIATNNIRWLFTANWDNQEWVCSYMLFNENLLSTSVMVTMSSDTLLPTSAYIAIVIRHKDNGLVMNVTDKDIVKPKLISLEQAYI